MSDGSSTRFTLRHGDRSYPLASGETTIGRGTGCGIVIVGEAVEELHAAAVAGDDGVILHDRSSKGTVRVNGIPVRSAGLEDGSQITFGEVELKLVTSEQGNFLIAPGQRYTLRPGENRVGRSPDAKPLIDDESVSREHALIVILPSGQIWLRDLKSSNGTLVGDRRLGEWPLSPDDEIEIGGEKLTFSEPAPPAAEGGAGSYEPTKLVGTVKPTTLELVMEEETLVLEEGRVTIGRTDECDVSFDGDPSVSREHAAIVVVGSTATIEDLGSSNGSFVNGKKIEGIRVLENGDRISIGSRDLEFRSSGPAQRPLAAFGPTRMMAAPEMTPEMQAPLPSHSTPPGAAPAPSAAPPREAAVFTVDDERRQAYGVLGLEPSADEIEVRKRFQERFSDLRIRVDNAPTPELKKTYQEKLSALKRAVSVVEPAILAIPSSGELPAAQPVHRTSAFEATPPASPESPTGDEAPGIPAPEKDASHRAARREPRRGVSLPSSTIVMGIVAVLVIVATASFTYLLSQAAEIEAGLRADLAERREVIAGLEQQIPTVEVALEELQQSKASLLENEELKICNLSSEEIIIRWLNAAYVDPTGRFETFDTAWDELGWDQWTIGPDQTWKTQVVRGTRMVWDGTAVFYSVLLLYGDQEIFRAGATPTLGGECYAIDLD